MLPARGKINEDLIRMMEGWRHSDLNAFTGPRIHSRQKKATESLAAYRIRSSFSQQRVQYLPDETQVICRAKRGKE